MLVRVHTFIGHKTQLNTHTKTDMELNIFVTLNVKRSDILREETATCKHKHTRTRSKTQYVRAYTLRSEHDLSPSYGHTRTHTEVYSFAFGPFLDIKWTRGKTYSYGHKQIRQWFRRAYPLFHIDSIIRAFLDINLSVSGGCRCCRKTSFFPFCFRKHSTASHNRREETIAARWM